VNATFLKFLPAIEAHAAVHFGHLDAAEREESIAETLASAFVNIRSAHRRRNEQRLKPSTVARFAVLHTQDRRHVGGRRDTTTDVLSRRAQRTNGFRVHGLPWDSIDSYDVLKAPDPVWRLALLHDRRTPVIDQVRIRIDLSEFLARQSDRTRTLLAMRAAGHKQTEIADRLGLTPAAICQRLKRARREWKKFQDEDDADKSGTPAGASERPAPGGNARCARTAV
jgi:DNA-directed RNA polymerase specialized sigma24 family protein